MNFTKSFVRVLHACLKHKVIAVLLIVIQFLFLISMGFVGASYQLKVLEDAQGIIQPLENANFDSAQLEGGAPFLGNMNEVLATYQSLKTHLQEWAIYSLLVFLVFGSILWVLSHRIILGAKPMRKVFLQFSRFILTTLTLTVILYLISMFLLKDVVFENPASFTTIGNIIFVVFLVLYYFATVAFALLPTTNMKSCISIWYRTSIQNIFRSATLYLLSLIVIILLLGLMYVTMQSALIVIVPFIITLVLVLLRLFWVVMMDEISRKA